MYGWRAPKIYIHWCLITVALLHTMIIRMPTCRKCCKYQKMPYTSHEVLLLITCFFCFCVLLLSIPNFGCESQNSISFKVFSKILHVCRTVFKKPKTLSSQRLSRLCGSVVSGDLFFGVLKDTTANCKVFSKKNESLLYCPQKTEKQIFLQRLSRLCGF